MAPNGLDIAGLRAWCLALGQDRAAAGLRCLAPDARPGAPTGTVAAGDVVALLGAFVALELRYAGRVEGIVLAHTRALIEDELWP